jgi:hypothetical protein
MNENQNPVKRGRGRPLVPTATKTIRISIPDANGAYKVFGKGRVKAGTKCLEITLHRSVKDYQHGITPVTSINEVVIKNKEKKHAPTVNVQVTEAVATTENVIGEQTVNSPEIPA